MGQKVNPVGLRIGVVKDWNARWFADKKNFSTFLVEDNKIRKAIKTKYYDDSISSIKIERKISSTNNNEYSINVTIYTSKPSIMIGSNGAGVTEIQKYVEKIVPGKKVSITIENVVKPEVDAQLVAESIAQQLENRVQFRRAMKQAISRAMKGNVKGIKTMVSFRLDGAEIARSESYHEGSIPLQTLRAEIDYGFAEANTTFGKIGVKTWIYKGEKLGKFNSVESNKGGNNNVNA